MGQFAPDETIICGWDNGDSWGQNEFTFEQGTWGLGTLRRKISETHYPNDPNAIAAIKIRFIYKLGC